MMALGVVMVERRCIITYKKRKKRKKMHDKVRLLQMLLSLTGCSSQPNLTRFTTSQI